MSGPVGLVPVGGYLTYGFSLAGEGESELVCVDSQTVVVLVESDSTVIKVT